MHLLRGCTSCRSTDARDCPYRFDRIEAHHPRDLQELDHINPPLAALEAHDPALRLTEPLGDIDLPQTGLLPLRFYQCHQRPVLRGSNRPHAGN